MCVCPLEMQCIMCVCRVGCRGHNGSVNVPAGVSGCTHWFGLSGGNSLHCLSTDGVTTNVWYRLEWDSCSSAHRCCFLPHAIPFACEVFPNTVKAWRMLTATDVGNTEPEKFGPPSVTQRVCGGGGGICVGLIVFKDMRPRVNSGNAR